MATKQEIDALQASSYKLSPEQLPTGYTSGGVALWKDPNNPNGSTSVAPNYFGPAMGQYNLSGGATNNGLGTVPGGGTVAPLTNAQTQQNALADIISPQNQDARRTEINNSLLEAKKSRASMAESIFGQKMARAETVGEQQIAGAKGIQGQNAGFNQSTANMAFMNSVVGKIEDTKKEIDRQKQAYIDEGNWEASKAADAKIEALDNQKLSILLKQTEWAIGKEQTDIENVRADKTLEYNLGAETRAISAEERATAQKEKETIQNLMFTYPSANILPTDGIEDAARKAGPFIDETRKLELEKLKAEVAAVQRSNRPSGGGADTTVTPEERNSIAADIAAIRGSDGYVDTAKYGQVRENIAVNAPKLLSWFDSTYGAQNVMNPNDPTAKKYFQTGNQQITNQSTDLASILNGRKAQGFSRKDIETEAKAKYGRVPDAFKTWLDNNY